MQLQFSNATTTLLYLTNFSISSECLQQQAPVAAVADILIITLLSNCPILIDVSRMRELNVLRQMNLTAVRQSAAGLTQRNVRRRK
jgi:hypothetical protein